jgi:Na+/melibiose symporter-like transporter
MAAVSPVQPPSVPPAAAGPIAHIPRRVQIGYATGSFVTGSFGTVPGLLLLPYLTDTLGIKAFVAGLLVLLPKAWDVVVNPLAGRISDRTSHAQGGRRPFLLMGLVVAVLFASMFAGVASGGAAAVWILVTYIACASAFAFFQVPYGSMPADMTEAAGATDPFGERTRMMTWRVAALGIIILVCGVFAPQVRDAFANQVVGYRVMGAAVALVIAAGTLSVYALTRSAPPGIVVDTEKTLRAQLRVARGNRPFRVLVACFVVQAAGVAAMLAGVQYFAEQILHNRGAVTTLFACVVIPAILSMPVWNWVGSIVGKLRSYVVASLIITVSTFALAASPVLPVWAIYTIVGLIGLGYAGQQLYGLAMLPDCIAYDTLRTGRRQAGVFTGLWTAAETLGLAVGPYLFAQTIQLFGYVSRPATSRVIALEPGSARLGVLLGFTVIPGIVVGLALLFLRSYDLTPPDVTPVGS